ncbi:serine/threonine protein kinase, CMGC, CDC2/CDK sub [Sporothrix epigloea]|uniref:cyclin-dependent kinase n=1 Tax=Sporothrix epigloea TaxID=1892477 RepID=A0ABP0DA29_9PEZI
MYMVMPYMDHDLSGLLDNPSVRFTEPQIKCYLLQLLEGLRYLHDSHILHRDMKAANLLINNHGILQIADFGLARHYDGEVPMTGHGGGEGQREYTSLVVTRWYRPPELLLQLKRYTTAIDVWGVGCVFGEMLTGKPILAGSSDAHQLDIIWELCGSPTEDNMPGWKTLPGAEGLQPRFRPGNTSTRFSKYGPAAVSLLTQLLKLDWRARTNAMDALQHPYFRTAPLPAQPGDIPVFEESHELDRRKFDDRKAALPPAPKGGTVGRGHAEGGFGSNGNNFGNDGFSRSGGGGHPQDRGPRGGAGGGDEGRRPAWARHQQPHGLPPRPPPPANDVGVSSRDGPHFIGDGYRDRDRDRDRARDRDYRRDRVDHLAPPPRGRGGARGADGDSYVPAYMREGSGTAGSGSRDSAYDRTRDRRRYDEFADRGTDWYENGVGGGRHSQSRSPMWNQEHGRDRDSYRR